MLRPLALLTLVGLLILISWFFLAQPAAPPTPNAPPPAETGNSRHASTGGITDPNTASNRSAAPAATASEGSIDEDAAPTFALHGRCVLADGETPIADCSVQLRLETGGDKNATWIDVPTSTQSGVDGTFSLGIQHDDWTDTTAVRIHKNGFVPRTARWQCPQLGTTIDLGDVTMLRAISIAGTIVDRSGVAVEDAGMMFVYIPLTGKPSTEAESMLRTRSDAAGRFAFDVPAHPGEWYVGVEGTGALVAPRSIKLATESSFDLKVIVERPDPTFNITGTVADASGRPLAGMRLSATGEGFIGRGRSNTQGRFTIQRAGPIPDDGKAGTLLSVRDPDTHYERVSPQATARLPWGKDGVAVIMRERAGQNIRIVDELGQPVRAYTLFAFRGKSRLGLLKSKTQRGLHEDGRCRLQGLQEGPHAVVVVPRDESLATTTTIPFAVVPLAESPELLVTVKRTVPTTIKVVGSNGDAIANSTIELLQSFGNEPPTATTNAPTLRTCDQPRTPPAHAVLTTGTTDASGATILQTPPGSWHVRVTGTHHLCHVQTMVAAAPTTLLQIMVQPAAVLTGRVQPPEAFAQLRELAEGKDPVAVIVKPHDQKALPAVAVAEDGTFTVGGLESGLHKLSLRYWLRTGSVRADNVKLAVADVTVQAGEATECNIDAKSLLPGTVTGRIVAGGEPLANVHCFLRRNGPGSFLHLRIDTDSDGRFTGLVPAGDYGFSMTYPAQPGPGWLSIVLPDEWQLAPGQTHTIDFDVPLRRVLLRVIDADKTPIPGTRVRIVRKGYSLPGGLKTNERGEVEVFPAPLDAFQVEVSIDGKKRRLGPFDLPPGTTNGTIVVPVK